MYPRNFDEASAVQDLLLSRGSNPKNVDCCKYLIRKVTNRNVFSRGPAHWLDQVLEGNINSVL